MIGRLQRNIGTLAWSVVVLVGAVVLVLVLALQLFPRLDAGQAVLDNARPAYTDDRVTGARAGINIISTSVDLLDPVMTAQGGAVAEVSALVTLVSSKLGVPPDQVVATLKQKFPHTAGLLLAIPLESVTSELPNLESFLEQTLGFGADQLTAALKSDFPHLNQSITALPTVTSGWENVPGTEKLSRFDGTQVHTVPDLRAYFSKDAIPAVLETQKANFQRLDTYTPKVSLIPVILTVIGVVAVIYGLLMILLFRGGLVRGVRASLAWAVVALVGVIVLALVFPLGLYPRLSGGQDLLDSLRPAFTDDRIAGVRAGADMVSSVVDLADPIVLAQGGAASEVPKLISLVSQKTGLPAEKVVGTLEQKFPHTAALLEAIPLEAVSAELPNVVSFLSQTLGLSAAQLTQTLTTSAPHLAQSLMALPIVTGSWASVPGTDTMTRFSGAPVHSVPAVRDYFSKDVVPVLESQKDNFQKLDTIAPKLTFFPPLLTLVGVIVLVYGLLMVVAFRRADSRGAPHT
ncbi:MAG: hypothetical protein M3R48_00015 [Candidatus Dormibacteraeota bacterium]|nr:hypothetical protein [Candidatus Dormibacteraeota bacterium]